MGLLGIKTGRTASDRSGNRLLQRGQADNSGQDESSQLGLTAKLRLDNHVTGGVGTLLATIAPGPKMYNAFPTIATDLSWRWLQGQGKRRFELRPGPLRCDQPARPSADHQTHGRPVQGGARNCDSQRQRG